MVESVTLTPGAVRNASPAGTGVKKETASKEGFSAPAQEDRSTPINPRLRYDAVSGVVVTEFLDHGGAVQAQTPSNAVLAYLRAGLGEDGRTRNEKSSDDAHA